MKSFKELYAADVWAFDLDNTLYPAECDLFQQVSVRMREFVSQTLNLPHDEAHKVQKSYFREYGTTMRGLMVNHKIDPQDYLDYVHDIDLSPLPQDPDLVQALQDLPGRKIIFTNGSKGHATRVMKHLGIYDFFEGIYDIVSADYRPKPAPDIYDDFLKQFNINPETCVMVEDMACNLKPAHDRGMTCAFISTDLEWANEESQGAHIHHRIDNLSAWLKEVTAAGSTP